MQNPLDLALSYAARDWPVFPCRSKEEIDDHTGEILAPKTPFTSNGFRGASKNERIIKEWWRRTPDAMVGTPTGKPIKAWVLDLDIKPGVGDGHDWLADMESTHGALPATARAKTMGGGTHIFFRHVEGVRNRGGLGIAVDVRGDGGYIVAPGSQAADGRSYQWLDDTGPDDITDAPEWLTALVLPPPVSQTRSEYRYSASENPDASEIEDLLSYISPDCVYQDWVNVLMAVHSALGQDGLAVADAWSSRGKKYRSGEVARKWRGFDSNRGVGIGSLCELARQGGANLSAISRHHNDDRQQDNTRLVDISRMIANGLAKAAMAKPEGVNTNGDDSGRSVNEDVDESASPSEETSLSEESIQTSDTSAAPPAPPDEPPPAIIATPFEWVNPASLARREFVYGTHYIRKYVSVTSSPGGLGKTSNSIVEALAMGTGRALLGSKPPAPVKVWLFNAEDPRDEMERRIMAACIQYRLKPADIAGRLFLDTGREQDLVVAIDDKKGVRIQQPIVEAVVEQIKRNQIDVMIIDPFVSTHRVNENDNGAIDAVAKLWGKIADETNCAIDVVHHIRKVSDRDATVEDSRGAVSLISAARSARILNQMSSDQAKEAGINPEDRFSYFNVNAGKANMTVRSGRVDWRRLVSVPLGNGRGLTKPQDHAGVVTEWKWPSAEEVAGETSPDQLEAIKTLVDNGAYKEKANAKPWVGEAVAYVLGLDSDDKTTRKKIGVMLQQWFSEGHFQVVEEKDHVNRRMSLFVRSAA